MPSSRMSGARAAAGGRRQGDPANETADGRRPRELGVRRQATEPLSLISEQPTCTTNAATRAAVAGHRGSDDSRGMRDRVPPTSPVARSRLNPRSDG